MSVGTFVAVGLAALFDRLVGEFPERIHPIALFGRLVAVFDRHWTMPRAAGVVLALALPLLAGTVVAGIVAIGLWLHPVVGIVTAGVVLFSMTSLRMLLTVSQEVTDLTGRDLDAARAQLHALAGRDADTLSAGHVRSAVVESAAENLADGLVAPLGAFMLGTVGGLTFAAGAATWVKAVNTLDSMLGYPGIPHGGTSARLDDIVMYLPARASALLIMLVAREPDALWTARMWARNPASPNSGWPMATLAAIVGVQLEKPGAYTINPVATLPDLDDARRALLIVGRAGVLAYVLAGIGSLLVPGSGVAS